MRVRNKRVIITGASHSDARACIEALLALGAHVIAADRLRTELDTLRADLDHHHRLHVAECDARDEAGLRALVHSASDKAPIDALLHFTDAPPAQHPRTIFVHTPRDTPARAGVITLAYDPGAAIVQAVVDLLGGVMEAAPGERVVVA